MGTHCECGICGHFDEKDCIEKNCKCCSNFHIRSGSNANEKPVIKKSAKKNKKAKSKK